MYAPLQWLPLAAVAAAWGWPQRTPAPRVHPRRRQRTLRLRLCCILCLARRYLAAPPPPTDPRLAQTRDGMKWDGPLGPPPLLVKIAPDLSGDDMEGAPAHPSALWGVPAWSLPASCAFLHSWRGRRDWRHKCSRPLPPAPGFRRHCGGRAAAGCGRADCQQHNHHAAGGHRRAPSGQGGACSRLALVLLPLMLLFSATSSVCASWQRHTKCSDPPCACLPFSWQHEPQPCRPRSLPAPAARSPPAGVHAWHAAGPASSGPIRPPMCPPAVP